MSPIVAERRPALLSDPLITVSSQSLVESASEESSQASMHNINLRSNAQDEDKPVDSNSLKRKCRFLNKKRVCCIVLITSALVTLIVLKALKILPFPNTLINVQAQD